MGLPIFSRDAPRIAKSLVMKLSKLIHRESTVKPGFQMTFCGVRYWANCQSNLLAKSDFNSSTFQQYFNSGQTKVQWIGAQWIRAQWTGAQWTGA
jgi:hypothetical protein